MYVSPRDSDQIPSLLPFLLLWWSLPLAKKETEAVYRGLRAALLQHPNVTVAAGARVWISTTKRNRHYYGCCSSWKFSCCSCCGSNPKPPQENLRCGSAGTAALLRLQHSDRGILLVRPGAQPYQSHGGGCDGPRRCQRLRGLVVGGDHRNDGRSCIFRAFAGAAIGEKIRQAVCLVGRAAAVSSAVR